MPDPATADTIATGLPSEDRFAIDRRIRPARKALRYVGLALLAVMIALPVLQVALRQTGLSSFIGAGELTRFMLICVVFLTLPYVVSSGASIRMEELTTALPARARRVLLVLIAATGTLGFSVAALSVAVATWRNLNNATPTLQIPYWVFFSAAFLGLAFAAIECLIQTVKAVRERELYVTFAEEQPPDEEPEL